MINQTKTLNATVRLVEIKADDEGQRLDNFLLKHLKGVPKSRVYRLLRKGEVRVNKGRKDAKYRLIVGDCVRIPPVRMAERTEVSYIPDLLKHSLEQNILFEDDRLMVINKPEGFAVHGGSGIHSGVIEGLRFLRPEAHFLELVHRLDRDTSGCLIIAKKRSSLRVLHELFRGEGIKKNYLAVLHGGWFSKKQLVDVALLKNVSRGGERMVIAEPAGKPAQTLFTRMQSNEQLTLVQATPRTGRTHQIRVHAQWMGHAIVGDTRYAEQEKNQLFRDKGFKRMFLHAQRLQFQHPGTGKQLSIEAPMPEQFEQILSL